MKRLTVLLLVLLALAAPLPATAAPADVATSAAPSVSSPRTFLDPIGDNPVDGFAAGADITAAQIYNGPHWIDVRFRLQDFPSMWTPTADHIQIDLDVRSNGPRIDYRVDISPDQRSLTARRNDRHATVTCFLHSVTDLGSNGLGRGFSARFPHRCVGGRHSFRVQLFAVAYLRGDAAPDLGLTRYIRPATT